jgi:hypothetical protein
VASIDDLSPEGHQNWAGARPGDCLVGLSAFCSYPLTPQSSSRAAERYGADQQHKIQKYSGPLFERSGRVGGFGRPRMGGRLGLISSESTLAAARSRSRRQVASVPRVDRRFSLLVFPPFAWSLRNFGRVGCVSLNAAME